jgi:hypothetical protein
MCQLPLFTWNAEIPESDIWLTLDCPVRVEFVDEDAQKCLGWIKMSLFDYLMQWGGNYAAA